MTDRMKEIKNKSDRYLNCKSSSPKNLSDFFAIKDIFYLLSEVERLQKENERLVKQEDDYSKIISEIIKCSPIPANKRVDNKLESPWEVVARIRKENEKMKSYLRTEPVDLSKLCPHLLLWNDCTECSLKYEEFICTYSRLQKENEKMKELIPLTTNFCIERKHVEDICNDKIIKENKELLEKNEKMQKVFEKHGIKYGE